MCSLTVFSKSPRENKLHLLLDHDGYLPSFAVVTEGKTSESAASAQAAEGEVRTTTSSTTVSTAQELVSLLF